MRLPARERWHQGGLWDLPGIGAHQGWKVDGGEMSTAQQIADRVVAFVAARVNVTTGTRADIARFVAGEVMPLTPAQASLTFQDEKDLKGQSDAILKLLKARRSSGALNWELAEIALKYTSRVSNLRDAGWKINCERQEGRSFRYSLHPTDW